MAWANFLMMPPKAPFEKKTTQRGDLSACTRAVSSASKASFEAGANPFRPAAVIAAATPGGWLAPRVSKGGR